MNSPTSSAVEQPAFLAAVLIWGGHMNTMVFWLSSLAVPAIWIFGLVFRKRDLLIVHTKRGGRRLIFHGSGEPNEIAAFLDNAATSFGYRLGPPT